MDRIHAGGDEWPQKFFRVGKFIFKNERGESGRSFDDAPVAKSMMPRQSARVKLWASIRALNLSAENKSRPPVLEAARAHSQYRPGASNSAKQPVPHLRDGELISS